MAENETKKEIYIDVSELAQLKGVTSRTIRRSISKGRYVALLEYIAMEDCKAKQNLEILCGEEIKKRLQWLDKYCEENGYTQEQVLKKIINGQI